jgi:hypothetical protein
LKNLAILLVIILALAGAFYIMKPHLVPMESEYLEFKLGAKASPEMKATAESDKFKTKTEIYYSIFSLKPFEADTTVEVVIRDLANLVTPAFTEKLGTVDKKVMRPINPVNSDVAGKYVIEIVKDGSVIARKLFLIGDDVAAPVAAPEAPATTEVKAEAPAATEVKTETPATTEVKAEAPAATEVKTETPATTEVKAEAPATTEVKAEAPVPAPAAPEAPVPAPEAPAAGENKTN